MITASVITLFMCSVSLYLFTTVIVRRERPRVKGLVRQLKRDYEFIQFLPMVVYYKIDPRVLARIITRQWAEKNDP